MNPNILFLLLDSFRADKCYGKNKTSKTPNLDALIKDSVYFSNVIASSDGTTLSLNSLFTGLFPFKTGLRAKKLQLHSGNFIDILKKNGYHVYGITPHARFFSPLYDYENLEKGISTKPDKSILVERKENSQEINIDPEFKKNKIYRDKNFIDGEILSAGTGQKIVDILASKKMKEPWFFYIHMCDLHWPHVVPSEFNNDNFGQSHYERVLSALDYWLGKFLEKIDVNSTLFILTGDHGHLIPTDNKDITSFEPDLTLGLNVGKHLMPKFTHGVGTKFFVGLRSMIRDIRLVQANKKLTQYEKRSRLPPSTLSLFDEAIRIPLVFSGYGISPKIISQQVRNVDIFPTIFDIIGLSSKKQTSHGKSMLPLFHGKKMKELPAYFHSLPYEKISLGDIVGIRTSKFKYFRGSRDPKKNVNLYDLTKDPWEDFNIAKERPDLVNKMEQLLTEITTDNLPEYRIEEISKKELAIIEKELKELGYM